MINGNPVIRWIEAEVDRMEEIENLKYAIVGKFSRGWTTMEELEELSPYTVA